MQINSALQACRVPLPRLVRISIVLLSRSGYLGDMFAGMRAFSGLRLSFLLWKTTRRSRIVDNFAVECRRCSNTVWHELDFKRAFGCREKRSVTDSLVLGWFMRVAAIAPLAAALNLVDEMRTSGRIVRMASDGTNPRPDGRCDYPACGATFDCQS